MLGVPRLGDKYNVGDFFGDEFTRIFFDVVSSIGRISMMYG